MNNSISLEAHHTQFSKLVVENFKFLAKKYNFEITEEQKNPSYVYSCRIIFKNKTTCVEISYDLREDGIGIDICRLVNGHIPKKEIFLKKNAKINRFSLYFIISVYSSNPKNEFPLIHSTDIFPPIYNFNTIDGILKEYAIALEKYSSDALSGDFGIFDKLEKVSKKNVEKYLKKHDDLLIDLRN